MIKSVVLVMFYPFLFISIFVIAMKHFKLVSCRQVKHCWNMLLVDVMSHQATVYNTTECCSLIFLFCSLCIVTWYVWIRYRNIEIYCMRNITHMSKSDWQSFNFFPQGFELEHDVVGLKIISGSCCRYACRGLFERHKLLFSFHMCVKILEVAGKLNMDEYSFFLRGGLVSTHL